MANWYNDIVTVVLHIYRANSNSYKTCYEMLRIKTAFISEVKGASKISSSLDTLSHYSSMKLAIAI